MSSRLIDTCRSAFSLLVDFPSLSSRLSDPTRLMAAGVAALIYLEFVLVKQVSEGGKKARVGQAYANKKKGKERGEQGAR